jgi:hypothetical protein
MSFLNRDEQIYFDGCVESHFGFLVSTHGFQFQHDLKATEIEYVRTDCRIKIGVDRGQVCIDVHDVTGRKGGALESVARALDPTSTFRTRLFRSHERFMAGIDAELAAAASTLRKSCKSILVSEFKEWNVLDRRLSQEQIEYLKSTDWGREIISATEEDAARTRGRACKVCGYSLLGLQGVRCPECGSVNDDGGSGR